MRCSKCNATLKALTNYCESCGNPVIATLLNRASKIHARNLIVTGIVGLTGICIVWAALLELIPNGWIIAVVNIGFFLISLSTLIPIHAGLKFILGDGKSWLAWLLASVIGVLMISVIRPIVGDVLSTLFT